jgi:hypothetical protein
MAVYHNKGFFVMYTGDLFTTRFGPSETCCKQISFIHNKKTKDALYGTFFIFVIKYGEKPHKNINKVCPHQDSKRSPDNHK